MSGCPYHVIPLLGVDAQGGADVLPGAFGLVEIVQQHGARSPTGIRVFSVPEGVGGFQDAEGKPRPSQGPLALHQA